jgi:mRNA interferase RelE/StbE
LKNNSARASSRTPNRAHFTLGNILTPSLDESSNLVPKFTTYGCRWGIRREKGSRRKTLTVATGYRVVLKSSAEKELQGLSAQLNTGIVPRLENLIDDPRPPGCKKLNSDDKEWRIRVGDRGIFHAR